MLRTLDFVYNLTKFTDDGRLRIHPLPRLRITGSQKSSRLAVPDLPSNCYNQQWLAALDEGDIEALRMRPEADLKISSALQQ